LGLIRPCIGMVLAWCAYRSAVLSLVRL
jgi:hypothetical protein